MDASILSVAIIEFFEKLDVFEILEIDKASYR